MIAQKNSSKLFTEKFTWCPASIVFCQGLFHSLEVQGKAGQSMQTRDIDFNSTFQHAHLKLGVSLLLCLELCKII